MFAAQFLIRYFAAGIDDFFTTMAIGLFGLRPGPSVRRIEMWPSFNGVLVSHDVFAKRSACQASAGFPSTLEMHRLRRRDYEAAQQNQPGYDQGKAPLDTWLRSMVFHYRLRRVDSTLPPTVEK